MNINKSQINVINKQFYNFSQKTLKASHPETIYVISNLQKYERNYKRIGMAEVFIQKAQQFAEDCFNKGLTDFTGIIYAFLIKIPNLDSELRELIIKRAIQIAQKQHDEIHELARVVDLKKHYQNTKAPKKKYVETLFLEENILKRLVRNFSDCSGNFKTVSREIKDKEVYEYRLGLAQVDISKAFYKTDKKLALNKLKDARKIFVNLNKNKEVFFTDGLIDQLKH